MRKRAAPLPLLLERLLTAAPNQTFSAERGISAPRRRGSCAAALKKRRIIQSVRGGRGAGVAEIGSDDGGLPHPRRAARVIGIRGTEPRSRRLFQKNAVGGGRACKSLLSLVTGWRSRFRIGFWCSALGGRNCSLLGVVFSGYGS